MVAVHMLTALAQKETAKQTILKQLRDGRDEPPCPAPSTLTGTKPRQRWPS